MLTALCLLACWDINTDRDRLARAEQAAVAKSAAVSHALKAREAKLLEAEGAATEAGETLQTRQTELKRQADTLAASWQSAIKRLGDSLQAHGGAGDGGTESAGLANPNDTDAPDVFASAWKLEAIQQQFHNERRPGAEQLAVIAGQDGGEAAAWPPPLEGEALRRELRKKPDHFYDPAFEISHSNPAKDR